MTERTGQGDPERTIALLWRVPADGARPGPKPKLDLDTVVAAAVTLADTEGLAAVTMRVLARRLGVSAMTLYAYVPGREELLDLMVDAVHLARPRPPWRSRQDWRTRVRSIARSYRELFAAHPWLAIVGGGRPSLGPGMLAAYEYELAAFDDTGLSDVDRDAALALVVDVVRAIAANGAPSGVTTDAAWWERAGPALAAVVDPAAYPLATRVGTAAGTAQGSAYDPDRAHRFALARVLDGLAVLIDEV